MAAKLLMGACGIVSVGAWCTNMTKLNATLSGDVAVDSFNAWFTDPVWSRVWRCPYIPAWYNETQSGVECRSMGTGWDWPQGIAVHETSALAVTVYVSEGDTSAPKVKKCVWSGDSHNDSLSCSDFGSGWDSPRGLALDKEGNVFITNAYGDNYGVWKCTPSAVCTLVGNSHQWPHDAPDCIAVDSQGNVYVTGVLREDSGDANYVKKCTSSGTCSDFGGDWPKGGLLFDNAVAVGPHDTVYICDSGTRTLIRCSTDDDCENLGAFDCGRNMAIDQEGRFYIADDQGLSRFCVDDRWVPVMMKDIQI